MMATVPHVTYGLGIRKFQAGGFLLTQVYQTVSSLTILHRTSPHVSSVYITVHIRTHQTTVFSFWYFITSSSLLFNRHRAF